MSKWFKEQRIKYIEEHLLQHKSINRENIMKKFNVSIAIASRDIKHFKALNPEKIIYNNSSKKYEVFK